MYNNFEKITEYFTSSFLHFDLKGNNNGVLDGERRLTHPLLSPPFTSSIISPKHKNKNIHLPFLLIFDTPRSMPKSCAPFFI